MPNNPSSLIDLQALNKKQVQNLFQMAMILKSHFDANKLHNESFKGTAALLFFEPSTRTRFSFESACVRAGFHPLIFNQAAGSSLEKGETIEDTVLNIEAMRPLFFVMRASDDVPMDILSTIIQSPIINAGWGRRGHPTQALLDAMTLFEKWENLEGKKVLFVGDVLHSRVVRSHLELANILGYEIGFCGPKEFIGDEAHFELSSSENQKTRRRPSLFSHLDQALDWADAVVALRVQKERHKKEDLESKAVHVGRTLDEYRSDFGLNQKRLKKLKPNGLLLHPGPINYGVELERDVLSDPRSVILQLVENGVFLREALIRNLILEGVNQ